MAEWVSGTTIGDYIGTTIRIHSPIPHEAPETLKAVKEPAAFVDIP